jgi:hypothetical protein
MTDRSMYSPVPDEEQQMEEDTQSRGYNFSNLKFLAIAVVFWGVVATVSVISAGPKSAIIPFSDPSSPSSDPSDPSSDPAPVTPPQTPTNTTKPNIVFILADDLSWNSLGYMDYDLAFATPTLTALASKGVIMTNYYSQELCTPSRAALLTGRYPTSLGMYIYIHIHIHIHILIHIHIHIHIFIYIYIY